jgi:hypothetical protein
MSRSSLTRSRGSTNAMRTELVAALLVATLAGCTVRTVSVADSEGPLGSQLYFTAPVPPEQAWRRVLERSRECLSGFEVVADYFAAANSGRISVQIKGTLTQTLTTTWVEPVGAGSQLRVSYFDEHKGGGAKGFATPIGEWANGRPAACP